MITALLLINILSLFALSFIGLILYRHGEAAKKQMQKDEQLIKQLKKAIKQERDKNI
jgi:hypothetical protein